MNFNPKLLMAQDRGYVLNSVVIVMLRTRVTAIDSNCQMLESLQNKYIYIYVYGILYPT